MLQFQWECVIHYHTCGIDENSGRVVSLRVEVSL